MKKIICTIAVLAVASATIIALCSFTFPDQVKSEVCSGVSCQGKHCSYTVGCDCPGFAPKTNGDVWEESYCKRCGHHKKYHK